MMQAQRLWGVGGGSVGLRGGTGRVDGMGTAGRRTDGKRCRFLEAMDFSSSTAVSLSRSVEFKFKMLG